jgi:hypothetical protein
VPVPLALGEGTGTVEAVACAGLLGPWRGTFAVRDAFGGSGEPQPVAWTFAPDGRAHVDAGDTEEALGSGPHFALIFVDLRILTPAGPRPSMVVDDVTVVEAGFPDRSLRDAGRTAPPPTPVHVGVVAGC